MINFTQYQQLAKRTCPDLGSLEKNIQHMQLGLYTEIGEVLDIYKKELAYGKKKDLVNLSEELADISWYLVNWLTFLGGEINNDEVLEGYNLISELVGGGIQNEDEIVPNFFSILNKPIDAEYKLYAIFDILMFICKFYKLDYFQALENNINKLKVRYPEKFTQEAALNRNLEAERVELEK